MLSLHAINISRSKADSGWKRGSNVFVAHRQKVTHPFCSTYSTSISTVVCWSTYAAFVSAKPPQCCSAGRWQKNAFGRDGLTLRLGTSSLSSFGRLCSPRLPTGQARGAFKRTNGAFKVSTYHLCTLSTSLSSLIFLLPILAPFLCRRFHREQLHRDGRRREFWMPHN